MCAYVPGRKVFCFLIVSISVYTFVSELVMHAWHMKFLPSGTRSSSSSNRRRK